MKQEYKEHWLPLLHMAHHKDGKPMYEISNTGKVRKVTLQGYKDINPHTNPEGYLTVRLLNSVFMPQTFYMHRLAAVTFLPNPNGWDTVDHIDGDKSNNSIRNLRWVSRGKNISLGHESGAIRRQLPKRPVRLSKDNREMLFETMSKAAFFLGVSVHAIQAATYGHYRPKGWTVESLAKPEINGNLFNEDDF